MKSKKAEKARHWSEILPLHPAAEMFPPLSDAEQAALQADISQHGLHDKITLFHEKGGKPSLLEGRHRANALEAAGKILFDKHGHPLPEFFDYLPRGADPVAFVISKNLYRRHLTAEQKRDSIARWLKSDPSASDRKIAQLLHCDHKTVASERADRERAGEIPHLDVRTGADGKEYRIIDVKVEERPKEKLVYSVVPLEPPKEERRVIEVITEPPPKPSGEVVPFVASTAAFAAVREAFERAEQHYTNGDTAALKIALQTLAARANEYSGTLPETGGD